MTELISRLDWGNSWKRMASAFLKNGGSLSSSFGTGVGGEGVRNRGIGR